MSKTGLLRLTILFLVVWSYFARPVYDFIWIAAGRVRDKILEKTAPHTQDILYDDVVALNTRLVSEMDDYIRQTRHRTQFSPLLTGIRYSSVADFSASTEPLRAKLRQTLAYPLPDAIGGNDFSAVQQKPLGEDDLAVYTLLTIPAIGSVQTGLVNAVGVLIVPKKHSTPMPLIIACHGRGGMPDRAVDGKIPILQPHTRDLAHGAVERGWAVFEPIFVFYGKGYPENIRDLLTIRAQEAGTSLLAMEFTKTERAIDYLLSRPEFDANRLGMVGLSYGGFNTLFTTALDPRIRVAVVSAYFSERADILDSSEPFGFYDWRFTNSLGILRDTRIAALVCPRPLQIQSGTQDQLFPIESARKVIPETQEIYRKLGLETRFEYHEFIGRHDFDASAAWLFVDRAFAK